MDAAIFALTRRGLGLSSRIAKALGAAVVFGPDELAEGGLKKQAARAFKRMDALIFISAAGIAVRSVAPFLRGKHADPAVVVVDERGRFSISLLSGHMGGANELAQRVALATGATAVITTATDIWGLPSVEDLAKRFSLAIEDPKRIKAVNSAILEGRKVFVVDADARRRKAVKEAFKGVFTCRVTLPAKLGKREAAVLVTSRRVKLPRGLSSSTLVLRPKEVVAGIGCGRGVGKAAIRAAMEHAFYKAGLSTLSIRNIATIDIKKNERGLVALARELCVPIEAYGARELGRVKCPSGPSKVVLAATGTGAVAEPAALLSSGAERLWLKKTKKGHVTVAAAIVPSR